jgi:polyisoprenoid-binding protein YceI
MKKWSIDSDHSVARFSVRHFMIADIEGLFSKMIGVIQFDPPDLGTLSAEAEIDVRSLNTGGPARDEHLLSPDFFHAEQHPRIFFKTTAVTDIGGNHATVAGDLTIRGMRNAVTLAMNFYGPVKSPFSGTTCIGFSANGRLNRSDYGMTASQPMDGRGLVIGLEVGIYMQVEADLIQSPND